MKELIQSTKQKQKKFQCLILLFFISVVTAFSQTPLPKGAKLQAILYPKAGMIAVGYVYKKQFVENQEVTFLKKDDLGLYNKIIEKDGEFYIHPRSGSNQSGEIPLSSLDTVASGVYFTKDGIACIKGIVHSKVLYMAAGRYSYNEFVYEGVFQISNSEDGSILTTDPNKFIYNSQPNQYPDKLELTGTDKLKITIVDIYSCQRYYEDKKNQPVTLQKQSDSYTLKIEFDDRILETAVNSDIVKRYGFFAFDDFIKSSQNVKLNFKDGNAFTGIVEKNAGIYKAKQGEYKFVTGEKYTGTLGLGDLIYYNKGRIFVPDQGETIFADGTAVSGDWLKQYNFTDDEWKQIYENSRSLTEIRNMAVRIDKEKQEKLEAEKLAQEQAEKEKQEQINQSLPIKEPKTDMDRLINELAIFRSSVVELDESIDVALNTLAETDKKMRSRGAVGVGPGNNNPDLIKIRLWAFIQEKMICISQGLHTLDPETDAFKKLIKEGNLSARYFQDYVTILLNQNKCMKNSPFNIDKCAVDCYDAIRSLSKKMKTDDRYWSKESNIKCSVLEKCTNQSK